ncbi:glycosyltransferase family 2 protein [Desulfosoma sp.]
MSQVTVIVLNWNGVEVLPLCLAGLRCQTYAHFTVWVIDNGSTDGSAVWVREHHPEVTVIAHGENRGFCRAYNEVLRLVATPYVALLNNDAVPDPEWLSCLVSALETDPGAWAAASKMVFWDFPEVIDRAGDAYTWEGAALMRGRGEKAWRYGKKERVFGACAGAALYRTSVFRELGFFDEDFFLLHEDVDVSFRARLWGYECVYVPEALVYHKAGYSVGRESATAVYYGHRNVEWVYLKNMPTALLCITWPFHLFYVTAAGMYFLCRGRGRWFLAAKRDALRHGKEVLRKRSAVQKRRVVSSLTILRSLSWDLLVTRLRSKRLRLCEEAVRE